MERENFIISQRTLKLNHNSLTQQHSGRIENTLYATTQQHYEHLKRVSDNQVNIERMREKCEEQQVKRAAIDTVKHQGYAAALHSLLIQISALQSSSLSHQSHLSHSLYNYFSTLQQSALLSVIHQSSLSFTVKKQQIQRLNEEEKQQEIRRKLQELKDEADKLEYETLVQQQEFEWQQRQWHEDYTQRLNLLKSRQNELDRISTDHAAVLYQLHQLHSALLFLQHLLLTVGKEFESADKETRKLLEWKNRQLKRLQQVNRLNQDYGGMTDADYDELKKSHKQVIVQVKDVMRASQRCQQRLQLLEPQYLKQIHKLEVEIETEQNGKTLREVKERLWPVQLAVTR